MCKVKNSGKENLIDKYLRLFSQKYKHVSLDFGLNKKEYYICDRFGARVM